MTDTEMTAADLDPHTFRPTLAADGSVEVLCMHKDRTVVDRWVVAADDTITGRTEKNAEWNRFFHGKAIAAARMIRT